MTKKITGRAIKKWQSNSAATPAGELRIIGGSLRGRKIAYSGDPRTRPMMDVTREALFNLAGAWCQDKLAIDLFAGTGAVGFEALSRGASRAIFVERHIPTKKIILQNAESLGVSGQVEVIQSDTFFWAKEYLLSGFDDTPWAVFCCPPYAFYLERQEQMVKMLEALFTAAPPGSIFAVESDVRFSMKKLPQAESWKVRQYSPAQIAVWRPAQESQPDELNTDY